MKDLNARDRKKRISSIAYATLEEYTGLERGIFSHDFYASPSKSTTQGYLFVDKDHKTLHQIQSVSEDGKIIDTNNTLFNPEDIQVIRIVKPDSSKIQYIITGYSFMNLRYPLEGFNMAIRVQKGDSLLKDYSKIFNYVPSKSKVNDERDVEEDSPSFVLYKKPNTSMNKGNILSPRFGQTRVTPPNTVRSTARSTRAKPKIDEDVLNQTINEEDIPSELLNVISSLSETPLSESKKRPIGRSQRTRKIRKFVLDDKQDTKPRSPKTVDI